jgi:hypothetical protein
VIKFVDVVGAEGISNLFNEHLFSSCHGRRAYAPGSSRGHLEIRIPVGQREEPPARLTELPPDSPTTRNKSICK